MKTMEQPCFSILIPVYNVEKYLRQCVESVLGQTYTDYEVILIDDGSTDHSGQICDAYGTACSRVHVYHQSNQGLMMTRKAGILQAKGQYCLFLDSDDHYAPDLLKEVAACIEKDNPDLVIFNKFTEYVNQTEKGAFGGERYRQVGRKEALLAFMGSNQYTSVFTKVIRRKLILPCLDSIYIPVSYAEDALQTAYFILLSERIAILDRCLYYYRIRESSLIHQKTMQRMLEILDVKQRIYELIVQNGYLTGENERRYFGNVLNDFMDGVFRINNTDFSFKNRRKELQTLKEHGFLRMLLESKSRHGFTVYNRIRVILFDQNQYAALIMLDHLLLKIQQLAEAMSRKRRFE